MKGLRSAVIVGLAVTCLVSGGYAMKTASDFQQEAAIYAEATENFVTVVAQEVPLATPKTLEETEILNVTAHSDLDVAEPTPEAAEAVVEEAEEVVPVIVNPLESGISVNFDGLQQVNEDIVGWIHFHNSAISYPLLQGEDNQTYLDTTYRGDYSVIGSLFLDYRIQGDFTQQNTIIYGHNVSSGTMFGSLKAYRSASYGAENPYFFVLTEAGELRYEVCYALVTTSTSFVYDYGFSAEGDFAQHIAQLEGNALYDMGVTVTEEDKLITLSTCTGVTEEERFVLIGRLDTE